MNDKAVSHPPIDGGIFESLEAQDRFYRENPRDESITNQTGFDERWEMMIRETEEAQ